MLECIYKWPFAVYEYLRHMQNRTTVKVNTQFQNIIYNIFTTMQRYNMFMVIECIHQYLFIFYSVLLSVINELCICIV